MKYVCLGFYDEAAFAQIPQADAQKMFEECFAYDDVLRRGGHFLGGEALDSARNAVTLRLKDGEVQVTDGPYVETKETLPESQPQVPLAAENAMPREETTTFLSSRRKGLSLPDWNTKS